MNNGCNSILKTRCLPFLYLLMYHKNYHNIVIILQLKKKKRAASLSGNQMGLHEQSSGSRLPGGSTVRRQSLLRAGGGVGHLEPVSENAAKGQSQVNTASPDTHLLKRDRAPAQPSGGQRKPDRNANASL